MLTKSSVICLKNVDLWWKPLLLTRLLDIHSLTGPVKNMIRYEVKNFKGLNVKLCKFANFGGTVDKLEHGLDPCYADYWDIQPGQNLEM